MRTSKYLLSTLKEIPVNAEMPSHQLMLRAGMIRKLSSGLYTWLPTGLRILNKVIKIVREEMNNAGAIEVSVPMIQPENLWQKSGRWTQYGRELMIFKDRGSRSFVLGPTDEEAITVLMCNEINSYKQLPLNVYQIKTKFRDEIRPRFGVIRSREFIMKDAYSFHTDLNSLQVTYKMMSQVYNTIFTRMGLEFRVVQADTGSIGGSISHEFQVLANSGEDEIVFSTQSNYAANIKLAEAVAKTTVREEPREIIRLINTPNIHTIAELIKHFILPVEKTVKTIIVRAHKDFNYPLVALIIRGDHQLNNLKAEKLPQTSTPLVFANEEEIRLAIGAGSDSLGPVNLPMPMVIDHSVAIMSDFVAGANCDGKYFFGINWERDLPIPKVTDLRNVVHGDISPDRKGTLCIKRGIEVGHIFQLGTKYSETMKASIKKEDGKIQHLIMGCYGIGISRVIAASIEQNHDQRGIIWPDVLAPFNVAIIPINAHQYFKVQEIAETLYQQLQACRIDVLLNDSQERPGVIFSNMELIGIPHMLIIGQKNLDKEVIEYKNRRSGEKTIIKLKDIVNFLTTQLSSIC